MSEILQKIRDAVAGKKTYLTAVIGILTALVAWGGGELTDWQAITAVWVALQVIFVRAGSKNDGTDAADKAYSLGFQDAEEITGAEQYWSGFSAGYEQGDEDARYEDE